MHSDGRIKFQYNLVDICNAGDSSNTIGITSAGTAGSPALQYCSGTTGTNFVGPHIASGRAIWFYPVTWTHNYGVTAITSPVANFATGPNVTVPVTATFTNLAITDESAPVKYSFNGGATVEEATAVLTRWALESHTFATAITTPADTGTYTLTVWCDLASDELRGNDTLRTTIRVLKGMACGNEVTLPATLADSATYNNCGMGDNTPGVPCVTTLYQDMVFMRTVPAGSTLSMWLTTNSWTTWSPRFSMRWGGSCPGANTVHCVTATPYNQLIVWTNSTGSAQSAYFIVGGSSSTYCGNFKLNWREEVCAAVDEPYNETFEGVSYVPVLPTCMSQENGDGIPPVWETYGTNPHGGTKCAMITGVAPASTTGCSPRASTWKKAAITYVRYLRRNSSATIADSIEVLAGVAPTASAMTISVAPRDTCKSTAFAEAPGRVHRAGVGRLLHRLACAADQVPAPYTYIDERQDRRFDRVHGADGARPRSRWARTR